MSDTKTKTTRRVKWRGSGRHGNKKDVWLFIGVGTAGKKNLVSVTSDCSACCMQGGDWFRLWKQKDFTNKIGIGQKWPRERILFGSCCILALGCLSTSCREGEKKKKRDELIRSEADAFFCDSGENQLKVGQHVWFDPVPNSATSLLTSLAQGFRTDFRCPRTDENNTKRFRHDEATKWVQLKWEKSWKPPPPSSDATPQHIDGIFPPIVWL